MFDAITKQNANFQRLLSVTIVSFNEIVQGVIMRVRMLTILLDRQVYKGTRILLLSVEKDKLVLTPVENYVVQDFGASFTNGGNQEAG